MNTNNTTEQVEHHPRSGFKLTRETKRCPLLKNDKQAWRFYSTLWGTEQVEHHPRSGFK